MEQNLLSILSKIKVPTRELTVQSIQELMIMAKKCNNIRKHDETWNEIAEILWVHLLSGLHQFENQLFCATCFYSTLVVLQSQKQEYYLNKVLEYLNSEQDQRNIQNACLDTPKVTSLMYGMFQSSFLLQIDTKNIKTLPMVLDATFQLLLSMAYEYSIYTFITFKTLSTFKKVSDTDLQDCLFGPDKQVKLLNLTNHNWENPITGVRDLNRSIFRTLLTVVQRDMYEKILLEINTFYWNKAKYLMLTEIIDQSNDVIALLQKNCNWVKGLLYSLGKPGLVSAGADMYFAIVKKLKSIYDWCSVFLRPLIAIFNGTSSKSIENFSNYWCLTTLKTFPSLADIILDELGNFEDSEQKLYGSLNILKQANKLGSIKIWASIGYKERCILEGLDTCNNHIRMLAFDIICISHKTLPEAIQYDSIVDYIKNNINSDCTVLRISMLNSFSNFLSQLYTSFASSSKKCQLTNTVIELCSNLQQFLYSCLHTNGNYQRKITCIKLANVFIDGLKEIPKKRQIQTRQSKSIIDMLKEKGQWIMHDENVINELISLLNDPAEDVRENVSQLLLIHYSKELRRTDMMNCLIENAMKRTSSKFFYEISCGQSTFRLITNLLIIESNTEAAFKNAEEIFEYAYNELIKEYELEQSVLATIDSGKQLHSLMSILKVVLEVSLENRYKIQIQNFDIFRLINVLEEISKQFTWDKENSTSYDFSQMSDMIQNMIAKAGCVTDNQTQISGLEQIVLNCVWLNVKVSCDLSSLLVKYQKEDSGIDVCTKCLDIITHVLETCRHKGAIEAAGSALGQAIQHLTSLSEELELSKLPYLLLKDRLKELITEASKMASVTRRGAGLSIMVHRIVSNDSKKGKPLFNYFMKTLLKTCNTTDDIPTEIKMEQNIDNEKDLPKAIYIHFLTRIVTDSSLASDMMFYSAELAELAFRNLTNRHWQIRNAALQLYGALIPKLFGQKKVSGTDAETIATVACDEFRTHCQAIWRHVLVTLKNKDFTDKVQYHSNLIPILNMLANSAVRYNFSYDMKEMHESDMDLLNDLMLLLDSPIYTVRRLVAKSILNLFSFENIYDCLVSLHVSSENCLHGSLILILDCYNYYGGNIPEEQSNILERKFGNILNTGDHSYLSKKLYEEMFFLKEINLEFIKDTLVELKENKKAPGLFLWANNRIEKFIQSAEWDVILLSLELLIYHSDNEYYCRLLLKRIEKDNSISRKVLLDTANIFLNYGKKFNSNIIWEILYNLSLKNNLEGFDLSHVYNVIRNDEVTYPLRYLLPLAAKLYSNMLHKSKFKDEIILKIAKIIFELTDPEVDIDMRHIAVMANNELSHSFKKLPEAAKVITIKSAIILLQDEDEDVRMQSVTFYKQVTNANVTFQPYVCLTKLMNSSYLRKIISEDGIETLHKELSQYLTDFTNSKIVDEYNPFSNDSKNIYLEVQVFSHLIESIKNA